MDEKEAFESWLKNRNKQGCIILPNEPWEAALEYVKQGQEPVTVKGKTQQLDRMIICSECGNKRCTKATNHELRCTNSNDPRQLGSDYAHPAPQPDVAELVEILKAFVFNSSCQVNHPAECERAEKVLEKMEGKQ